MFDEFNLSNNEKEIFEYHTYANVSNEDKESISKDFEDICSENILYVENDREAKRHYDFDRIEDEIILYAWDNLSSDEWKYMKDMFENFKKGVDYEI